MCGEIWRQNLASVQSSFKHKSSITISVGRKCNSYTFKQSLILYHFVDNLKGDLIIGFNGAENSSSCYFVKTL